MQTCWSLRYKLSFYLVALCLGWLCCSCVAAPYEAIRSDEIPHDCDIPVEWQGWYGCKETIVTRQRSPSVAVQSRVRAATFALVHNPRLLRLCLQHKLQAARADLLKYPLNRTSGTGCTSEATACRAHICIRSCSARRPVAARHRATRQYQQTLEGVQQAHDRSGLRLWYLLLKANACHGSPFITASCLLPCKYKNA